MTKRKPPAEKKKVGAKRAFASVDELQKKIDAYFASCTEQWGEVTRTEKDIDGEIREVTKKEKVQEKKPLTKVGLAVHLKVSKETLSKYRTDMGPEFADAIKSAYAVIENDVVHGMLTAKYNQIGAIFYLKNAFKDDYRDRYDHTSDGKELPAPVIVMYGKDDPLKHAMDERAKQKK